MQLKVRNVGNSLGNIIPKHFVDSLDLHKGDILNVELKEGVLMLEPVKEAEKVYSLDDLLAQCTKSSTSLSAEDCAWLTMENKGLEA